MDHILDLDVMSEKNRKDDLVATVTKAVLFFNSKVRT